MSNTIDSNIAYLQSKKTGVIAEALKPVKRDIISVLKDCQSLKPMVYIGQPCYALWTNKFMEITGAKTKPTASRHLNYICFLGLLDKIPQYENPNTGAVKLMKYNERFLNDTGSTIPMNIVSIPDYTDIDRQSLIKERANMIMEKHIPIGKFSYALIHESISEDIADSLYFRNDKKAPMNKRASFDTLKSSINRLIQIQGYCTTEQILRVDIGLSQAEISKLIGIYKNKLLEMYHYGRPTATQKSRYYLQNDKWIWTDRKE